MPWKTIEYHSHNGLVLELQKTVGMIPFRIRRCAKDTTRTQPFYGYEFFADEKRARERFRELIANIGSRSE